MGKNKGSGKNPVMNGLERRRFPCGHTAFTDAGREDCPKCKVVKYG